MSILLNDEEIGNVYDTALSECPHFQWDSLGVGRYLVRAQAKHIVEWVEGGCSHRKPFKFQEYYPSRKDCPLCWQSLKEEVG